MQIDFQCLYNETVFKERSKIPGVPIAFSPKALVISAKENINILKVKKFVYFNKQKYYYKHKR